MSFVLLLLLQATVPERMQQALGHLQAGETEQARTLLESIVADAPNHGPARLQLGQLAASDERWEDAREHLEVAVASKPQRLYLAWYLLGRARTELGDTGGAKQAFQEAIARAPEFLASRVALAEIADAEGDLYTSLAQYRAAAEIDSANETVWAALANAARRAGAIELARCAVSKAGESGATAYLSAVIEEEAQAVDEALRGTDRALELGFDNAAVYVTRGNLLHEKMRLAESIAAFEKALALDPVAAESLASFALTSLTTEEYDRVRALLERHVKTHPDSLNTLYGLGAMYSRDGELEKARAIFERLSELLPESSQVQYNLSMIYRRLGDSERAKSALARFRALKRAEDVRWERENEKHRLRLQIEDALDNGDAAGAARLGSELVASGATAEDLLLHAEALSRTERLADALKAIEAALETAPYDREALELGADLAERQGLPEEAASYRERLALLGDCQS